VFIADGLGNINIQ